MIPTVSMVYDKARQALDDTEVAGGQVFTDSKINPFYETAYREIFQRFDEWNVQFVNRYAHWNLAAHQTSLLPQQFHVTNFGEPIEVRESKARSEWDISTAVASVDDGWVTITTTAPHDIEDGHRVVILGVKGLSDDVNDSWTVTKVDATNFRLLGAMPVGTHTPSTGKAFPYDQEWSRSFVFVVDASKIGEIRHNRAGVVAWMNDRFIFERKDETRLLRIKFSLSGNPPTGAGDSIGIDDSLDYMGYRTASLAGGPFGADELARAAERLAIGTQEMLDDGKPGGFLGNMITRNTQSLQREVFQPKRWRLKRNVGRHRSADYY